MRPIVTHRKLNLCMLPDALFSCVGRHAIVTLVTSVGPDKAGVDHEHVTLGGMWDVVAGFGLRPL